MQERGDMNIVKQSIRMRRMMPACRGPREFFVWNCFAQEGVDYCVWASAFIFVSGLVKKALFTALPTPRPWQPVGHG